MNVEFNTMLPKTGDVESKTKNNNGKIYFGAQTPDEFVTSKGIKKPKIKKPFWTGLKALFLGSALFAGVSTCSDSPKYSGTENFKDMKTQFFNVEKETKDSILTPLITLRSKLTPENDFMKGVDIDVAGSYKDLDDGDGFRKFLKGGEYTDLDKGVSFYSDKNLKRRIVIQESAHGEADKMLYYSVAGKYTALPSMRQTLMHEVGHHFDEYFGHDHNADFALKWDSIVANKGNPYTLEVKPQDKDARVDYFWNAGLSDKQEFQDAMLKDFKHVADVKKNNGRLACNYEYYTQGIDLAKKITPESVDLAEFARSEVYANLFSYALGETDGDKTDFVDNFKHSYEIVKKDIKKYLDIDVDSAVKTLKKIK